MEAESKSERSRCPSRDFEMKVETAVSLLLVVVEALFYRETCRNRPDGDLPDELIAAALATLEAESRDTAGVRELLSKHGVHLHPSAPASYYRRANNQVSAPIEALIRDLLDSGWTKSAIAETLRINRRVVIRVSREAESAHCRANDKW
jgi:hypothetical protein